MKRMSLPLILFVVLIQDIPIHNQGYHILTATIQTESGTRQVEIRYYAESEKWARDIFNTIREGFPLLEKKIGVPCPVTWDILVVEASSLKAGVAGENRGPNGIFVLTGTSPRVIIHELCHYWFGSLPSLKWSKWILEGFPEAYTITVLRELRHPDGYSHWYKRLDQYEQAIMQIGDKPLGDVGYAPDFEDPRVSLLYSKSMVFCTWLFLFLGEESMHKINAEVIFKNPLRSKEYQEIAEKISGKNLDLIFSGWTYPGNYFFEGKLVSFEWFAGDGDKDGIDTLREIETGSSPVTADTDRDDLPDGYELLLNTDPKNLDTDDDGLPDGKEVPIIIDGKNTEWLNPLLTDEEDSESSIPQDVKALHYATDDRFLYFMIESYNSLSMAHHTGIQIDRDRDGFADFIFFFSHDHLLLSIWENGQWVETVSDPGALEGTFVIADEVIEFRIPKRMRQLRFSGTFIIRAYEFSVIDEEITDETETDSVSLHQNKKKSTDPLNPDTDGDKIRDGEDSDPLVAAPALESPLPDIIPEESAPGEEFPLPALVEMEKIPAHSLQKILLIVLLLILVLLLIKMVS